MTVKNLSSISNFRKEIRLALPSKGRLAEEVLDLLDSAGLRVYKPNPRQYRAVIPNLPGLTVLFQRPGDILVSVQDGSVDFGITGWDITAEKANSSNDLLVLHKELRIGACTLNVIVPENWTEINTISDLARWQQNRPEPLRAATRFPNLTSKFFTQNGIDCCELISAEGTLEIAPTIGYADIIVDLVSTGTTLRDNRLKILEGGLVLNSQACLIANRPSLKAQPDALNMARQLLEFIVAYLRASDNVAIFANIRGNSPEAIASQMFTQSVIGGLQGPTISQVVTREKEGWYAVHLIVRKDQLARAIAELRQVGGSGVVVTPVTYIFEEEPQACREMLAALEDT